MPKALVIIKKVLELEAGKGYQNTAAAGGLENFVNFLNQRDSVEQISSEDRERLISFFINYSDFPLEERKERIGELSDCIDMILEGSAQSLENFQSEKISQISEKQPLKTSESVQDPALYADIQSIHGIGEKNSKLFNQLGIHNVYDLIRYYPRRYQDFSKLKPIRDLMYGEEVTIIGTISGELSTRK